jgi:hypothetical protein
MCASNGLGAGRPLMPLNERGKGDLVGRQGGPADQALISCFRLPKETEADYICTNWPGFLLEPW